MIENITGLLLKKLFFTEGLVLSLEIDQHCRFDFIAVYDGSSTNSGLLGQVCGRGTPTFESSSDSLTVVLSTDYANSYRGFSAFYTSLYAENVNTSKSRFMFLGYSAYIETAPKFSAYLWLLLRGAVIPTGD